MTMIYDPIPFVKLVQKILVGSYEPIMGICGKIYIINLHNLQMLFVLWIKNTFSEYLNPAQTWRSPMEDFLAMVLPRSADTRAFGGSYPQIFFVPSKFSCAQKNLFQTYDKN